MAKRTNRFKVSTDFWKGLVVGIVIAVIGFFVYFQFFSSSNRFPPINDETDNVAVSCEARCWGYVGRAIFKQCREKCVACARPCEEKRSACYDACGGVMDGDIDCLNNCISDNECITACYSTLP